MEAKPLKWSNPATILFALYEDIFGNEILSLTNNHETRVITNRAEIAELRNEYLAIQDLYFWKEDSSIAWNEKNHPLAKISKNGLDDASIGPIGD